MDFLWNDGRSGAGAPAEASGDEPALQGPGLSSGTGPVRTGIHRAALFNTDDIASGIGHRFSLGCGRITLLLSLEADRQTEFSGLRKRRLREARKFGLSLSILFCFQNKSLEFSLQ